MVERLVYTEDVGSSSLSSPTMISPFFKKLSDISGYVRPGSCTRVTYVVHLMTNPTKGPNGVHYYVKRVPKDLIDKIGKERYSIFLRTKDPKEAKRLCGETDVQKEREFRALRAGPQPIPFIEIVGLAGLAYRRLVEARRAEPGEERVWRAWLSLQERIAAGGREPEVTSLRLGHRHVNETLPLCFGNELVDHLAAYLQPPRYVGLCRLLGVEPKDKRKVERRSYVATWPHACRGNGAGDY